MRRRVCCTRLHNMPRIKRERSEEPDAPSKRGRGRNRVGGDLASLLKLHGLTPRGVPDETGRPAEVGSVIAEAANSVYPASSKLADVAWGPSQVPVAPGKQNAEHVLPLPPSSSAPISLQVESDRISLTPLTSITLGMWGPHAANPRVPARPMHLLDTAGHVYDVQWAPHRPWLAVAVAAERNARSTYDAVLTGGAIQVWEVRVGTDPSLIMSLACPGGTPCRLAWHASGVLAASYSDGSVRVLTLPEVRTPSQVEAEEALSVRVPGAHAYSLAWCGNRLAIGCTSGTWGWALTQATLWWWIPRRVRYLCKRRCTTRS